MSYSFFIPIRCLLSDQLDSDSIEDKLSPSINKIKTLAAQESSSESSDALFQEFQQAVKKGMFPIKELISGIKTGRLTHQDLNSLKTSGALSSIELSHIQTQLHGGRSELSLTEVMELLKNKLLGKDDLVRILTRGDLSPEDLRILVRRGLLPSEVLQSVLDDVKDKQLSEKPGVSGLMKALNLETLAHHQLEKMILKGDFHPDDIEILVSENCLRKNVADKILENGAEVLANVYEEVEKFAELVEKQRFSFEELEVMRAKGVLGDALIHYLVVRDAIDDFQGQKLLEIEQDHEYLDPEVTDDESESFISSFSKFYLAIFTCYTNFSFLADALQSDEGFYPKDLSQTDIFSLWDHLSETYLNRPGKDDYFESYLDSIHATKRNRQRTSQSSTLFEEKEGRKPRLDASGNAIAIGRRKSSTAQVTLRKGTGKILINSSPMHEYFVNMDARCYVLGPFLATDSLGIYDVDIIVEGGGWSGQAQAIRHGIAKALVNFNPSLLSSLKELGLTTRDARVVERKKPGKAKARKSFQWVKR
eukprot:g823.t1